MRAAVPAPTHCLGCSILQKIGKKKPGTSYELPGGSFSELSNAAVLDSLHQEDLMSGAVSKKGVLILTPLH